MAAPLEPVFSIIRYAEPTIINDISLPAGHLILLNSAPYAKCLADVLKNDAVASHAMGVDEFLKSPGIRAIGKVDLPLPGAAENSSKKPYSVYVDAVRAEAMEQGRQASLGDLVKLYVADLPLLTLSR